MPGHVLMSEIEIIADGGRGLRWSAAEKLGIVEETLDRRCFLGHACRGSSFSSVSSARG